MRLFVEMKLIPRFGLLCALTVCGVSSASADERWFGDPLVSGGRTGQGTIQVADLNGDGIDDIVAEGPNRLARVYLIDAFGHAAQVDSLASNEGIAIIDDNHDPFPDLIATERFGPLKVYRNDGAGHFHLATAPTWPPHSPYAVHDMNGDGYEDFLGCTEAGVDIVPGAANGLDWTHRVSVTLRIGIDSFMQGGLDTPDLNADGVPDIVIGGVYVPDEWTQGTLIRWALGTGNLGFTAPHSIYPSSGNSNIDSITHADLDGDGDDDLAIAKWGIEDAVFYYDRAENTLVPGGDPFAYGGAIIMKPILLNIDGDAYCDAIGIGYGEGEQSKAVVFRGTAAGSFEPIQLLAGAGEGAFGRFSDPHHRDFFSVGRYSGDYSVSVWPVRDITADVKNPILAGSLGLRADPSIAFRPVRISLGSSLRTARDVQVIDLSGRVVRTLGICGSESITWDLKDSDGAFLSTGVYWLRASDGMRVGVARVIVCR